MIIGILWLVFLIVLMLWILGLVLSWGGWIWVFFVVALIAIGLNITSLTGKKSGKSFSQRRRR